MVYLLYLRLLMMRLLRVRLLLRPSWAWPLSKMWTRSTGEGVVGQAALGAWPPSMFRET